MAKYSYEFKLQVVQAYLDGEGGYRYLSKKYGVPSKRDIEKWVFAYKAFGYNDPQFLEGRQPQMIIFIA